MAVGVEHGGEIVHIGFLGQATAHHRLDATGEIAGVECFAMHGDGTQSTRDEGGAAGIDAIDAREGALIVGQVIESVQWRAVAVVRTALRHKRAGGQIAPTAVQLRAEDQ